MVAPAVERPPGTADERPRRSRLRLVARLAVLVAGVAIGYLALTFTQVWWASRQDGARPAEAIIVLGAAQYDGRPSPVLRSRLDHALELYREGLAPIVVVTGGRQQGDRFTEAGSGAAYLRERGVPDHALRLETSSTNSWESLAASFRFLRDEGIEDVLLVSDPYHAFRIADIAEDLGMDAAVSPADDSPIRGTAAVRALGRETAAVAVGRIIGYRRLMRLDEEITRLREPTPAPTTTVGGP